MTQSTKMASIKKVLQRAGQVFPGLVAKAVSRML